MYIIAIRMMHLAGLIDKDKLLNNSEGYNSLKNLSATLFNKLDPSLRDKLMKRGVSMLLNTNAGFDTEYIQIDSIRNEMVSAQLAVNSRVLLKLPFNVPYEFSVLDSLSSKGYSLIKTSNKIDYEAFLSTIRARLEYARFLKYGASDYSLSILITELKSRYPYSINLDSGFITITFPRSSVHTWFCDINETSDSRYAMSLNDKSLHLNQLNELNELNKHSKRNGQSPIVRRGDSIDSIDSSLDPSKSDKNIDAFRTKPRGLGLEDVVDQIIKMSKNDIAVSENRVMEELSSIFEQRIKPNLNVNKYSIEDVYRVDFQKSESGNIKILDDAQISSVVVESDVN
jgi:hypothetical protein